MILTESDIILLPVVNPTVSLTDSDIILHWIDYLSCLACVLLCLKYINPTMSLTYLLTRHGTRLAYQCYKI